MSGPPIASSQRLRWFARLLVSVVGVGVFLEAGARAAIFSDVLFRRISSPLDEPSWRLSWVRRHQGNEGAFRFSFDQHHPVRGWTLAPGLRSVDAFKGKKVSSNSRGLRADREYAIPKPQGVYRVALFGDSFTFGEDVSDDETFGREIERLVPGIEVLNFGVHGYGHDQMLLYLRESLPVYRPDVVLIGHVNDDSLRNLTTFRDYAKPRFRLRDGRLELEGTPVPAPDAFLASHQWGSRFLDLVTMARTRLEWRWGNRAEESDRLTAAIVGAMAREAREAGARPAIALLPAWNELGVASTALLPAEAFMTEVARRERVPLAALRPLFVERARLGARFEQVGHWGAAEHRVAAAGIVDFMRRASLLP